LFSRPASTARRAAAMHTTSVVVFGSGTVSAPPRKRNLGTREAAIFASIAVLESPRTTRTGDRCYLPLAVKSRV